jgi:hypothetical protein
MGAVRRVGGGVRAVQWVLGRMFRIRMDWVWFRLNLNLNLNLNLHFL